LAFASCNCPIGGARFGDGLLAQHRDGRVDGWIQSRDLVQVSLHQLKRRHFALPDESRLLCGGKTQKFVHDNR
jgi:hypothetical protein